MSSIASVKFILVSGVGTVRACQWRRNGDHPDDGRERFQSGPYAGELYEGRVVRRFRRPDVLGNHVCTDCGCIAGDHGWIDTQTDRGQGLKVCPGDWILTIGGGHYVCGPELARAILGEPDSRSAEAG